MAHIKRISFAHVGRNEGCLCDRCGQYIQNIVTVTYSDGLILNYGQDCFDKLWKGSKLTSYGQKLFKKALKNAKAHQEAYQKYVNGTMTAENDLSYQWNQNSADYGSSSYWYGKPYEEYRKWMIEEVFPMRFEEDQKELDRFSKVNFNR